MKDIRYIGVQDHEIDLFEGQYTVPNGMAYNSYLIEDEKCAVMDTVDGRFVEQWLKNMADVTPDYLIVQHMEPDHSAGIARFMDTYPDAVLVASRMAFVMMKNYFGTDWADRRILVTEGSTLCLGRHTLTFLTAPMVHWPEVIVTYDSTQKVLFSADGFGKFGALDVKQDWVSEARRYYIGIVGKYGPQVQQLLKKAGSLEISAICPLHGPVLEGDLGEYLRLYDTWSSYRPESQGVLIAYTSVYGHTGQAAKLLAEELEKSGQQVTLTDLARADMSGAVADAFRYDRLVLATTTYNADIFPYMREFIHQLTERDFQSRRVGIIENGSWSPQAGKIMQKMLEPCRELTILEPTVKISCALDDSSRQQLAALAQALCR